MKTQRAGRSVRALAPWRVTFVCLAAALMSAATSGCKGSEEAAPPAPPAKHAAPGASTSLGVSTAKLPSSIPHATGPFKFDGELSEPDWRAAARSGAFVDDKGKEARPYSEARFLCDDENLYAGLYAADDDLEADPTRPHDGPVWLDDSFSLRITPEGSTDTYLIDISVTGVVTDVRSDKTGAKDASWESGARVAVDSDGTLNNTKDEDEEWVVEAALPLAAMHIPAKPGTRIALEVSRCDTPHQAPIARRCGSLRAATGGPLTLTFAGK